MRYKIIVLLILFTSGLKAQDDSVKININSCIDGISRLHIKANQIWWEHRRYSPPGEHNQCRNMTIINDRPWRDWTANYQIEYNLNGKNDVLIIVKDCPNRFYIIQKPDSNNYWETIIELDDSILSGPHVYDLEIIVGNFKTQSPDLVFDSTNKITLKNVYFEVDKYDLLPESYSELEKAYKLLKEIETPFLISGHTDNTGESIANQKLSEARSKSVYDYFIKRGMSEKRMEYIGFGHLKPIDTNDTESGRQKNRRVEIELKK